jgi:protein-tyrosine phosphatase
MCQEADLNPTKPVKILFVCLGNICRSPAAHAVFIGLVEKMGISERFEVDSAGILDYHKGELPDPRMQHAAIRRGYVLTHRSRPVTENDFRTFDLILAMDREVLESLRTFAKMRLNGYSSAKLCLFTDFMQSSHRGLDVPDPYWSTQDGFEEVMDLIEKGCVALLETLTQGKVVCEHE